MILDIQSINIKYLDQVNKTVKKLNEICTFALKLE